MALTYVKASGIDTTGNYTMGNLTITANLTVANANITGPTTFSNITSNGNVSFTGSNISLGAVGNLHITGGSANYYLKTDGSGGLSWSAVTGGGGTFTANTAPPASANLPGDQWFNTSANILYEYLNDGTSNYWVDISSSSLTSAAGSGGSALVIKDEGSNLTTAATSIDFVGAGVTATNSGSDVTVTIPGGLSNARAVGYSLVFGG